ncbi:potassium voltage-gated channel subfamily V member 1 [Notothenia coriiceps]|uniref:Potassium voltage-gated channel subfamily V member 1 n=1 Tax=Notothenia coriiceps TaxID=8208 RepID=A0A6I9PW85_9TELE|nr:PREDICTED: potassium voltage-gated channel subfamily V member 1 [Notothenia coriiceps]
MPNYFGEKVALYYLWLGWYTKLLVPAAALGVVIFLYGLIFFNSNPLICPSSTNDPRPPAVCREGGVQPQLLLGVLDSSVFFTENRPSYPPQTFGVLIVNVGEVATETVAGSCCVAPGEPGWGKIGPMQAESSALELCDDADFLGNEFFFDRNSQTFQYVMNFYRTGHLHVREELCEISFLQEIQYWGIDEHRIDACCRERYHRRKEQKETLDIQRDFEDDDEDFVGAAFPALRRRLWDLLEKPKSSRAARTFGLLSFSFVVLSVINMVLISVDSEEGFDESDVGFDAPLLSVVLEHMCMVWFTVELALRFLCVRDKAGFSRSVPNVIDLLAVLPFYVMLAVERLHGESAELVSMGRVVQVLRLFRSLRMLKLGRHSTGLKSLGLTIAQCYEEVGILLLFLAVGISIFSAVIFALEHDVPATTFTSVPAAWWWATTSMTTVGYGDVRPDTAVGKLLAFLCILSGILILALPIAVINERFSTRYFSLQVKEAAMQHAEMLKMLERGSVGGVGVNLRDAYARSVLGMMRLHRGERASSQSSVEDDLWW